MKNFRDIYNKTFILKLNKEEQNLLINKDKEYCLCFGYIDREKGLMALLLNEVDIIEGGISVESSLSGRQLHIEDVNQREIIPYSINKTKHRQLIEKYKATKAVEDTRIMDFIDKLRKPDHPDIIQVVLIREGLKEESVWARITDLLPVQGFIICEMLEEPYQKFGYHIGSPIGVYGREIDDTVTLYCNTNPIMQFPREKLENGQFLESVIEDFYEHQDDEHIFKVMAVLRDSSVYVYYSVDVHEVAFMQSGNDHYIGVFSEEPEECKGFYIKKEPVVNLIKTAIRLNNFINGIVVNPYTRPFEIPEMLFDMILNAPSSVIDVA
ncbi:MAG: hypothetical protein ACI4WM_00365 [Erysipelotrichaceae bacterium]